MPFSILMDTARQFAAVWLIALHACTLRVVSGLGVGGTWAAGIGLAVLFFRRAVARGSIHGAAVFLKKDANMKRNVLVAGVGVVLDWIRRRYRRFGSVFAISFVLRQGQRDEVTG